MVSGANTTDYVLDSQNVIRTLLNGAVDRTYRHGPRGPEYERVGNNSPTWYLYDGLGSVLGTVDQNGNVTSARKYDVYGAVRQLTGGSGTRHQFVGNLGHPSDDETGLIYMRARYYDPVIGRFVNEDPAASGTNWYSYCDNNPTSFADNSGKFKQYTPREGVGRIVYCLGFEIGVLFTLGAIAEAFAKNAALTSALSALAIVAFGAALIGASYNGYQASDAEQWGQWASGGIGGGAIASVNGLLAMAAKTQVETTEAALRTSAGRMAAVALVATCVYGVMVAGAIHAVDGF